MKNIFHRTIFIFLLLPTINYSQTNDSLKKTQIGIFISGGVIATQYYSNDFFNYLLNKSMLAPTSTLQNNISISGNFVPNSYIYPKVAMNPKIDLGMEFISRKHKFHHLIEISYTQCLGKYTAAGIYGKFSEWGTGYSNETHRDTVNASYNEKIFSIGYKFQQVFKKTFFSFGINCSFNYSSININKIEHINGTSYLYDGPPGNNFPYSSATTSDSTKKNYYINFPLQVGVGRIIKIKNIVLKPAFYFTSCFMRGYNFYNLSLGIMYIAKRKSV